MKAFLAEEWGQEQLRLLIAFHDRYNVLGQDWSRLSVCNTERVTVHIAIKPRDLIAIVAWGPLLDEDLMPTPQWMIDAYDYDPLFGITLSCRSSDRVPEPQLEDHITWLMTTL